jgi:hypothetical protein
MKLIGKVAGWLLTLAASTIIALNIERLAVAHRLDQLVPDPGRSNVLLALAQRPSVLVGATLILGIWVGFALATILAARSGPKKDPHAAEKLLGAQMLNCAHAVSELQRWGLAYSDQDRRNVNSQLNMVMTDAFRMGLPTPKANGEQDALLDYLTDIGSWLCKGDFTTAILRAKMLTDRPAS